MVENDNNQKREFTGVWIPKEILLHKELSDFQKILYADIACFETCFMLNVTFAERYGKSLDTISRNISKLVELGYIIVNGFDGRKRYMTALHIHAMQHPQKPQGSIRKNNVSIGKNNEADSVKTPTIDNTLDNKLDNTIDNNIDIAILENRDMLTTNESTSIVKPPKPRDLIWDAICEACRMDQSKMTKGDRSLTGKRVKELKELNATPEEIKEKASYYMDVIGGVLTPSSLTIHWSRLSKANYEESLARKSGLHDRQIKQHLQDIEGENIRRREEISQAYMRGLCDLDGNPIRQEPLLLEPFDDIETY